jgi:ABC-type dipeptide/oligopeptide/nickel transport system permease component
MTPARRRIVSDDAPLVTLGQGDYVRHVRPSDLIDVRRRRLDMTTVLVLMALIVVFVLGVLMGAMLC